MPFTYEHSLLAPASPAAVWRLYSDVSQWPSFDAEAEHIELDGPFVAGSRGTMKFRGQDPLAFVLTEVEPGRVFTDETPVGDAVVRVRHRLDPAPEGGTRITYQVEIDGPEAFATQLGTMITGDIPTTMARLARLAEEHDTP
jgi:polyketide cyclase/dehydrase/lipid transport protein